MTTSQTSIRKSNAVLGTHHKKGSFLLPCVHIVESARLEFTAITRCVPVSPSTVLPWDMKPRCFFWEKGHLKRP